VLTPGRVAAPRAFVCGAPPSISPVGAIALLRRSRKAYRECIQAQCWSVSIANDELLVDRSVLTIGTSSPRRRRCWSRQGRVSVYNLRAASSPPGLGLATVHVGAVHFRSEERVVPRAIAAMKPRCSGSLPPAARIDLMPPRLTVHAPLTPSANSLITNAVLSWRRGGSGLTRREMRCREWWHWHKNILIFRMHAAGGRHQVR